MLASLLRPNYGRRKSSRSLHASPYNKSPALRPQDGEGRRGGDFEQVTPYEDGDGGEGEGDQYHREQDEESEDGDETPLLPIFSSADLDRLPVYSITHAIRLLVVQRCETTLSWDQLRSPQVSQFLVKPIQQQIRSSHFSRATVYALIANCLQFKKEGEANPGNIGVSRTRALICELLAMRLLKEFSTRELIDALSYDFDPLQGLTPPGTGSSTLVQNRPRPAARPARISTIEIAIRAQAKKFLAHPLVVAQLEAIWAGTIVFHSAADSLHRRPSKQQSTNRRNYGTTARQMSPDQQKESLLRRSATLYDPHDASLFKLSRLRVPRYRQILETGSLAIMIGLLIAVLMQRSVDITALEIFFWFWSAGFMLDSVVEFTEQGFEIFIISVWNAFDLGTLLLLMIYYVLRLYGILMPDARKHHTAGMAYDVLASTAVLLFPRAFSILDHYRYFSQLLIAFRMMALDLVAILILIVIVCSGFFAAFTLSFGDENFDASSAAYALFQILMGFTPAAWEIWPGYNILGKAIMTMFLIICHFMIVTILITVLTNSFMAIVQNSNEEHQFLFAVNTLSMVKSDALFSYLAPTNIIGWLLAPTRFLLPLRQFVKLNRTVIKVTHVPVLFAIFAYERIILSRMSYEPTDLVEQRGRMPHKVPAFSMRGPTDLFSPGVRVREHSIVTFHKDRALEEVFRRPFKDTPMRERREGSSMEHQKSTNVVQNWMQSMNHEGGASPPMEQAQSVLERLETRRPHFRRANTANLLPPRKRTSSAAGGSVASDPVEMTSQAPSRPRPIAEEDDSLELTIDEAIRQTEDDDGDDELVTGDEEDHDTTDRTHHESAPGDSDKENRQVDDSSHSEDENYFRPSTATRTPAFPSSLPSATRLRLLDTTNAPSTSARPLPATHYTHNRNTSTNTILYSPMPAPQISSTPRHPTGSPRKSIDSPRQAPASRTQSPSRRGPIAAALRSGTATPSARRTPRRAIPNSSAAVTRARPILPPRHLNQSAPNFLGMLALDEMRYEHDGRRARETSFNARALDLASDLGDNRYAPDAHLGTVPASLATQLGMRHLARHQQRREQGLRRRDSDEEEEQRRSREEREEAGMVNRIMLARMNTLEEGFREVLSEVRGLVSGAVSKAHSATGEGGSLGGVLLQRRPRERKRRGKEKAMEERRERSATPWYRERDGEGGEGGDAEVGAEAERSSV
ncbi:hypothetical protein H2199_003594 [Coniosporium tulheliwenetii]|uniref:Uncharacterized protein n=1 Tax=Coniosporium tulheliwenetii TaxID=3383036 RepID=A0ACC2ZC44_9PEZI|nr:hypothetical protein H2199_003594 [Cladosporium sp. JES 115]